MISRTKLAASLAGVATVALVGGSSLGAVGAQASPTLSCSVGGSVTIQDATGGGTGLASDETGTNPTNNVTFNQASLTCSGAPGDDAVGTWTNVSASGGTTGLTAGTAENCAGGQSNGTWTNLLAKAPDGVVDSGSISFTRVGTVVKVDGSITDDGTLFNIKATLQFTPVTGQVCGPKAVGTVTQATVNGNAVIS
jgi:hypothetical protein